MRLSPKATLRTLRLGVKSLLLHKLRSSLTVLGILIGVTAVIWLVAMGEGVSRQAQRQIEQLGATSIILRSAKPSDQASPGMSSGFVARYGLRRDDFARIVANVKTIEQAIPIREVPRGVRHNEFFLDARVVGCTPEYFPLNRLKLARGRLLTQKDIIEVNNVCVLAREAAIALFPLEDPIGKSVQIDRDFYVVVGETAERGASIAVGGTLAAQDYNRDIYIPLSTLRWRIGDRVVTVQSGSRGAEEVQLTQITLKVESAAMVMPTAEMVRSLLEKHHPVQDYTITVPQELLQQAKTLQLLFTVLLVLIAGISLLVGGIGIMNIMLATVTERTREIGIRRALGAKRSDILVQFLSETLVLTMTGGLLGVLLGLLCGPVVATTLEFGRTFYPAVYMTLPDAIKGLKPEVNLWSIIISLGLAVGVGLFFGLYPAMRAAKMDPIEALRHE